MIVVKIELHSANTRRVTELGRMIIDNDCTHPEPSKGNYYVRVGRKGQRNDQILRSPQRLAKVRNHPRLSQSVWCLLAKALHAAGYTKHVVDDTNELEQTNVDAAQ